MTKRANHEGSLYRRKNGLWCAQVTLNGFRLTKYSRDKGICSDWLLEMRTRINHGLAYEHTRVTLEEFLRSWLSGKELSRRPNTLRQYRLMVDHHVLPALGGLRMRDIRPAHLRELYLKMKAEGKGPRTVQIVHSLLHAAFNQAMRENILDGNPAGAVERPKFEPREFQPLTEAQVRKFLEAAHGRRHETLFVIALISGMRAGEIAGLKWSDVDWERGTVLVQRQAQRVRGQGLVFAPPKTKAGKRTIQLGQGALERLQAHRLEQEEEKKAAGPKWQDHDLVFTNMIGTPIDPRRLLDDFREVLAAAGLPKIRFHDLRHTSISLLLNSGATLHAVQKRAGHSRASVTTDIYGHAMTRAEQEASALIDELILPVDA